MIFTFPAKDLLQAESLSKLETGYEDAQESNLAFADYTQIEIQDGEDSPQDNSQIKKIIFCFLQNPEYGLYHYISSVFQKACPNNSDNDPVSILLISKQVSRLNRNSITITVPLAYCSDGDFLDDTPREMHDREKSFFDRSFVSAGGGGTEGDETFLDDDEAIRDVDEVFLVDTQHRTIPVGQVVLTLEIEEEKVAVKTLDLVLTPCFIDGRNNWARLSAFYSKYASYLQKLPHHFIQSSEAQVSASAIEESKLNELTDEAFFDFVQYLDDQDCYGQLLTLNGQELQSYQIFLNTAKNYRIWNNCNPLLHAAKKFISNLEDSKRKSEWLKFLLIEYKKSVAKALFIKRNASDATAASILIKKDIINAEYMFIHSFLSKIKEIPLNLQFIKDFFASYLDFIKTTKNQDKKLSYSPPTMSLSSLFSWSEMANAVQKYLNEPDLMEVKRVKFILKLQDIVTFQADLSRGYIDQNLTKRARRTKAEEKTHTLQLKIEQELKSISSEASSLEEPSELEDRESTTLLGEKEYFHHDLIEYASRMEPFRDKRFMNQVLKYVFKENNHKGFLSKAMNFISRLILFPFKAFIEIPLLLTSLAFYRLYCVSDDKFIIYPLHRLFDALFFIARATSSPIQNEKEMRDKGGWWSALSIGTTMVSWSAITIATLGVGSPLLLAGLSAVLPATAMAELTDVAGEINNEAASVDEVFPQSNFTLRATLTAGLAVVGMGLAALGTGIKAAITFGSRMLSRLIGSNKQETNIPQSASNLSPHTPEMVGVESVKSLDTPGDTSTHGITRLVCATGTPRIDSSIIHSSQEETLRWGGCLLLRKDLVVLVSSVMRRILYFSTKKFL